jgi:hypothetical protein
MSKIYIESHPAAVDAFHDYDHVYLVFEDTSVSPAKEYVVRGGPTATPGGYGDIVVDAGGLLSTSLDDRDIILSENPSFDFGK